MASKEGMNLVPVIPSGHLWAVNNIFPEHLADQVNMIDWGAMPYDRIDIGNARRRRLIYNTGRDTDFDQYVWDTLVPQIQRECRIKFTDTTQRSFDWWVDEPGFRPSMHTDGDKPSALQVYWQPTNSTDLGTAFYSTPNTADLTHYFSNVPNTGYLMLNSHEPRPALWHDMQRTVPQQVLRLCLYISFGPYIRL